MSRLLHCLTIHLRFYQDESVSEAIEARFRESGVYDAMDNVYV